MNSNQWWFFLFLSHDLIIIIIILIIESCAVDRRSWKNIKDNEWPFNNTDRSMNRKKENHLFRFSDATSRKERWTFSSSCSADYQQRMLTFHFSLPSSYTSLSLYCVPGMGAFFFLSLCFYPLSDRQLHETQSTEHIRRTWSFCLGSSLVSFSHAVLLLFILKFNGLDYRKSYYLRGLVNVVRDNLNQYNTRRSIGNKIHSDASGM